MGILVDVIIIALVVLSTFLAYRITPSLFCLQSDLSCNTRRVLYSFDRSFNLYSLTLPLINIFKGIYFIFAYNAFLW